MYIRSIKGFRLGDYGNNQIVFSDKRDDKEIVLQVKIKDQHYVSHLDKHYKVFYKVSFGREELTSNMVYQADDDDTVIRYLELVLLPKVNLLFGTHFALEMTE